MLSIFIVLIQDRNLNKIINHFCIIFIESKCIFEKRKPLFSIPIPILAESITSEDFMIVGIGHFHCFSQIGSCIFSIVFFHLQKAFYIESKGVIMIFLRIEKVHCLICFFYRSLAKLNICNLQDRIFIVRITRKNTIYLCDRLIISSFSFECLNFFNQRIWNIHHHSSFATKINCSSKCIPNPYFSQIFLGIFSRCLFTFSINHIHYFFLPPKNQNQKKGGKI